MTVEQIHRMFEIIRKAGIEDRARKLCGLIRAELKQLTPEQRKPVKKQVLRMLRTRGSKPHRYNKPVLTVIQGGRP